MIIRVVVQGVIEVPGELAAPDAEILMTIEEWERIFRPAIEEAIGKLGLERLQRNRKRAEGKS